MRDCPTGRLVAGTDGFTRLVKNGKAQACYRTVGGFDPARYGKLTADRMIARRHRSEARSDPSVVTPPPEEPPTTSALVLAATPPAAAAQSLQLPRTYHRVPPPPNYN